MRRATWRFIADSVKSLRPRTTRDFTSTQQSGSFSQHVDGTSSARLHQHTAGVSLHHLITTQLSALPAKDRHRLLELMQQDPSFCALFEYNRDIPVKLAHLLWSRATAEQIRSLKHLTDQVKEQPQATEPPAAADANGPGAASMEVDDSHSLQGGTGGTSRDGGATQAAVSLGATTEFTSYGSEAGQDAKIVVSLKAMGEVKKKATLALTCVLDRSGSMAGSRIALVAETSHFLIDQASGEDFLSFISYSSLVTMELPLINMTPATKAYAHNVIDALVASGGTDLYAGLEKGVVLQLEEATNSRLVRAVLLSTDGEANLGLTTSDEMLPALAKVQKQVDRVVVHTFGFGDGHQASLLQAIAEAQAGTYYYVAKGQDIPMAFGDALGGLLSVVAKSVKLTVTPAPGVTISSLRSGGVATTTASGAMVITFADLYAAESKDMLVTFALPAAGSAASGSEGASGAAESSTTGAAGTSNSFVAGQVEVEYVDPVTGNTVQHRQEVMVERRGVEGQSGASLEANPLVVATAARYKTAEMIEKAQKMAEKGQKEAAVEVLSQLMAELEALKGSTTDAATVQLLEVFKQQSQAASQACTEEDCNLGHAMMAGASHALRHQRAVQAGVQSSLPAARLYDNQMRNSTRLTSSADVSLRMETRTTGCGRGSSMY